MSFTVDSQVGSKSWLQDERKPDLRVRLLRLYIVFATIILVGALAMAWLVREQLEENTQAAELALAQTIATAAASTTLGHDWLQPWIDYAAGNETAVITIIDPTTEQINNFSSGIDLPQTLDWQTWQRQIRRTAMFDVEGTFITNAPSDESWLHAYATIPGSDKRLIIQRPTAVAFGLSQIVNQALIIAIVIYLAGGIFSWIVLSRFVIRPLERLETFSGRIRWRSQPPADEYAQIQALSLREDQFGSLARSLIVMNEETEKSFVQLSTLLETSRVVASSLDVEQVINNILDQVQNLFGVERCAVVVLNKRADLFRIRASRGLSEPYAKQLRIAPSEPNSPSMRALRKQTPIQVSDTETDLAFVGFRNRSRSEGFRSVLAIPLKSYHAPPAVLLLYKAESYSYSYSELELASSFGHHASIALENAALYARTDERLQEQTRRLDAIVESLRDGLVLESPQGQILYCNQQALSWLDWPRSTVLNSVSGDLQEQLLSRAVDVSEARQGLLTVIADDDLQTFDLTQVDGNGRYHDLRLHFFEVSDANGELLGRGQIWQDITKDKELDRMKSTLISTVSHELRTPLATIKGYASTLLADDVQWDADSQQEFLAAISHETDRLTILVKNLLDLSRIEAGTLNMHCELYSLNDLLIQITQGMDKELTPRLHLELTNDLPPVWMDVPRIGTVLRNLIENANKYSAPNSSIDLRTAQNNGRVLFAIRDYGSGIPVGLQSKIFDRFYRVENGLTRQVGGVGLGLAICKGFVDAHQGQIWTESADPGTVFTFSLPLNGELKEN